MSRLRRRLSASLTEKSWVPAGAADLLREERVERAEERSERTERRDVELSDVPASRVPRTLRRDPDTPAASTVGAAASTGALSLARELDVFDFAEILPLLAAESLRTDLRLALAGTAERLPVADERRELLEAEESDFCL